MKKLLQITFIALLAITFVGCSEAEMLSREQGVANNEVVVDLVKQVPIPRLTKSLERENIARRAQFINNPNRLGYLYLLTQNGQLIREELVQGKVSSLNSYLTPLEELRGGEVVQAADIDGTWGDNTSGIFWFTPEGVYREWTGLFLFSSERLTFDSKPVLIDSEVH